MASSQKTSRPAERRKFIFQTLQRRGEISLKEISTRFPGIARQSIKDDINALTDIGFEIEADRIGRETVFLHELSQVEEEKGAPRLTQKNMVASMVAGIVCGFENVSKEGPDRPVKAILDIHSQAEIHKSLVLNDVPQALQKWKAVVKPALEDYWLHTNRLVALDGGSTNYQTALLLKDIRLPCAFSPLTALSVCTNGRKIFHTIGDEKVRIRAIVCGGQQIRTTSIIGGRMAEEFLSNSALKFAISFIGATALDASDFTCETSTQEEVGMKSLFMEKSRLRIVCLDSKKLILKRSDLMRSGLSFSKLSPERIDLVVTNRPLRLDELPKDATDEQKNEVTSSASSEDFTKVIEIINERGIPCLVADRGPTLESPANQEETDQP